MNTQPTGQYDPLNATGPDEVENSDQQDNLQDADTLDDIRNPIPADATTNLDDGALDNQTDGDRQLTTGSDALDTGLNDSDLGADAAGLDPERQRYAAGGTDAAPAYAADHGYAGLGPDAIPDAAQPVSGNATGLATGVRE